MEKTSIVSVYIMTTIVLAMALWQLPRKKRMHTVDLTAMLLLGIFMNGTFMFSLFIEDKTVLSVIYTVVLIIETWLLYMFLRYAHARNSFWKTKNILIRNVLMVVIIVDNILILINGFTEILFPFHMIEMGPAVFVVAELNLFFNIHWMLCALMAVCIVMVLFRKAASVARIYRTRYSVGTVVVATGLLLDIVTRWISSNMNMWSVTIFSMGILCYYYMFVAYPMHRTQKMKRYAINKMSEPVLMFDYNNNLQVFNEAAVAMLGVSEYYPMEKYIKENELYYSPDEAEGEKKPTEFTRTKMVAGRNYLIHGQRLWDEREKFVGTLITYADITGQEKLKEEATLYATRDQLTGLWNRDYFFEMVNKTLHDHNDKEFVMVVSDVYQFKMFNEILGVNTGDDLLLAIAQAYRETCKRLWIFSRIAGDRFALLMPKADFDENSFMTFVRNVFIRKHYELKVHCYVGVYEITDISIGAESMYNRAYMALESIKGDLHKDIAYYHEEIRNKRIFETTTLDELDRALLNNEFEIYLQPQIAIESRKVVSAEALIRWNKPGRGIVSPGEFIPIFENNGMIAKLDYHVWELACRQLYVWKAEGFGHRSLSVNISAKDFYLADLYDSLTGLVERYKIDPKNLKLEITETAFVLDIKKQMALVKRLQAYGFVIEIDDFGSGYSSLNSLKDINVDILKMDMKFFEKTDDTDRAKKIVRSVVNLANELGMPVIAEGVETEEDIKMLKSVGCQMIQGYYFSKPLSVMDYEEFLKSYDYGNMEDIIRQVKGEQ